MNIKKQNRYHNRGNCLEGKKRQREERQNFKKKLMKRFGDLLEETRRNITTTSIKLKHI